MQHPHTAVLEKIYANFAKGDIPSLLSLCADNITFQIAGKSKLAGKYTKDTVAQGYFAKQAEMSGNEVKFEVHEIMASDRHAVALVSNFVTRKGETVQMRAAHIWRFENGKPVAWYEYPRDMYQFDSTWS
jgi:ketosteroid isomerase-like protein